MIAKLHEIHEMYSKCAYFKINAPDNITSPLHPPKEIP